MKTQVTNKGIASFSNATPAFDLSSGAVTIKDGITNDELAGSGKHKAFTFKKYLLQMEATLSDINLGETLTFTADEGIDITRR